MHMRGPCQHVRVTSLRFGLALIPRTPAQSRELARWAEEVGVKSLGVVYRLIFELAG
jgi:hypothetical protein